MTTKTTLLLALVLLSSVAAASEWHSWEGRIDWGRGGTYATIELGPYGDVLVTEKGSWTCGIWMGSAPSAFYAVATLYDANNNVLDVRNVYVPRAPEGYEKIGFIWVWTHFFDFRNAAPIP